MLKDIFEIVVKHREGFLQGLWVTFQISILVWTIGTVIGTIAGYYSSRSNIVKGLVKSLSFVISGIPVLVFLFWLHYPAQSFLNINVDPFYTVVFMLSLLNLLTVSEIVNTGIRNVPTQYLEVAKVCGMKNKDSFLKIQLPLTARHVLPSLLAAQVNILHLTLFASLISVGEIFRVSQRIISVEYKPVEVYTALGIFFLIVSLPINGIAIYLRRKYSRRLDER